MKTKFRQGCLKNKPLTPLLWKPKNPMGYIGGLMVIFINKFCQVFICKYIFSKDFSFCFAKSPLESSEHKVCKCIDRDGMETFSLSTAGEGGHGGSTPLWKKNPLCSKITPSPLKNCTLCSAPSSGIWELGSLWTFSEGKLS